MMLFIISRSYLSFFDLIYHFSILFIISRSYISFLDLIRHFNISYHRVSCFVIVSHAGVVAPRVGVAAERRAGGDRLLEGGLAVGLHSVRVEARVLLRQGDKYLPGGRERESMY